MNDTGVANISIISMAALYLLLIIPILMSLFYKFGIIKRLLIAILRMTVQLVLMGLYLDFIFKLNNMWINALWILIIITAAAYSVVKDSGLTLKRFFGITFISLLLGSFSVISFFIFVIIRPEPFYDSRYTIPIFGMVLGNSLRANIITLDRFYSSIKKDTKTYLTYIFMGASQYEAIMPYMRETIRGAVTPTISNAATMGLVFLPGMMVGQILGGSIPLVAIKYQIAIMIVILTATFLSSLINLVLSIKVSFDSYNLLKSDIFAKN